MESQSSPSYLAPKGTLTVKRDTAEAADESSAAVLEDGGALDKVEEEVEEHEVALDAALHAEQQRVAQPKMKKQPTLEKQPSGMKENEGKKRSGSLLSLLKEKVRGVEAENRSHKKNGRPQKNGQTKNEKSGADISDGVVGVIPAAQTEHQAEGAHKMAGCPDLDLRLALMGAPTTLVMPDGLHMAEAPSSTEGSPEDGSDWPPDNGGSPEDSAGYWEREEGREHIVRFGPQFFEGLHGMPEDETEEDFEDPIATIVDVGFGPPFDAHRSTPPRAADGRPRPQGGPPPRPPPSGGPPDSRMASSSTTIPRPGGPRVAPPATYYSTRGLQSRSMFEGRVRMPAPGTDDSVADSDAASNRGSRVDKLPGSKIDQDQERQLLNSIAETTGEYDSEGQGVVPQLDKLRGQVAGRSVHAVFRSFVGSTSCYGLFQT